MRSALARGKAMRRAQLMGGIALAALAVGNAACAEDINTLPFWDGTTYISSWGVPNTATYGQTITPTGTQRILNSFTFQLRQNSGAPPQYQAFIYQWDAANQRITGTALFSSGVFTAPAGAAFSPVTINTGAVVLSPAQQYVLFLTTSTQAAQANGTYRYGLVVNTAYAGGQFVYNNNGTTFSDLSSTSWSTVANDLAFLANMYGLIVPALPTGAPVNPTNVANAIDRAVLGGAASSATASARPMSRPLAPMVGRTSAPIALSRLPASTACTPSSMPMPIRAASKSAIAM